MRTRIPKTYDGTVLTTRHLCQLLPRFLEEIGQIYQNRPDLVMAAWPDVVGPLLAPMTKVVSFVDGILTVKVKNSTLYSLLSQTEKARLIKNLRDKFPQTSIRTINFRLG